MTTPISLNLTAATLEHLAERERETGQTQAQLAEQYIEEGLRMQRHPGIFFQDGATGRRAVLLGGPDVWEAISGIQPADGEDADANASVEEMAGWLGLSPWIMQAALNYYAEFREEIDERIALNRQAYDEGYAAWRAAQDLVPG
jgi:hypothetical protein